MPRSTTVSRRGAQNRHVAVPLDPSLAVVCSLPPVSSVWPIKPSAAPAGRWSARLPIAGPFPLRLPGLLGPLDTRRPPFHVGEVHPRRVSVANLTALCAHRVPFSGRAVPLVDGWSGRGGPAPAGGRTRPLLAATRPEGHVPWARGRTAAPAPGPPAPVGARSALQQGDARAGRYHPAASHVRRPPPVASTPQPVDHGARATAGTQPVGARCRDRVLLTGADGYIGVRLGDYLLERGLQVVGLDSGFHRVGWLYNSADLRPRCHQGHPPGSSRTISPASMPWSTWPSSRTIRWAS